MLARHYVPRDAAALDQLLSTHRGGDVRLDRDHIIVAGEIGAPCGALVWRPGGIVHEFECGAGLSRRALAAALINYAVADGLARGLAEAIFVVDEANIPMARYMASLGAVEEEGRIFTLRLR